MADLNPVARALLKGMTVADLRAALAEHPDDMPVIIYSEHGHRGESPASGITTGWYRPESTWGGEFHCEDYSDGTAYEADPAVEVRALFIEPIN